MATRAKNDGDVPVAWSADEKRRDRRVVRLEDFTEDEMALIARDAARAEDAPLDGELKDWKP